ncbi:hypothetical protein BH23THE1_BH23THE1_19280 [soil metagenome]
MPLRIIPFSIFILVGLVKMTHILAKLSQSLEVPINIVEFKANIKHFLVGYLLLFDP